MDKQRLDQALVAKGMVASRSQAESWIKLGKVQVDGRVITKPGYLVFASAKLTLQVQQQYVSRAGLKLESVAVMLRLNFKGRVVLDVGSSTGGFTDYALRQGAQKVIAVDVGTNQLHPTLRGRDDIELHERTDIRDLDVLSATPDIVVIDVSFISLREILPQVARLSSSNTQIVAMVKPQFESGASVKHKGVIKNDAMRRAILRDFETWVKGLFIVKAKADSDVTGAKGNRERFYLLTKLL